MDKKQELKRWKKSIEQKFGISMTHKKDAEFYEDYYYAKLKGLYFELMLDRKPGTERKDNYIILAQVSNPKTYESTSCNCTSIERAFKLYEKFGLKPVTDDQLRLF